MKKMSGLLLTFGSFLALEAGAATMWEGKGNVVHHPSGAKVDHKLEAKREEIRKEINGAHKALSQFSKIYAEMHAMRLEVETMHSKAKGRPIDQKHLAVLEKKWNKEQATLRMALLKKKVSAFENLPSERDIWVDFPDEEARSLEGLLREIRKWQSYENIDLQTGQVTQQAANLYEEPANKKKFTSMKLSELMNSDDEEDF